EHGDDLALGIRVDLAVPGIAPAANRGRRWSSRELDAELFLERLPELVALELVEQLPERGPIGKLAHRKAAALADLRVIRIDAGACLLAHEGRHYQILEWLFARRRAPKRFQVETVQTHRFPLSELG